MNEALPEMADPAGPPLTVLDAHVFPDNVAERAAAVTPGSAVLPALAAVDPGALSYPGLLDALAAWHKQDAWLAVQQHRRLAALAHAAPLPVRRDSKSLAEWDRKRKDDMHRLPR